jgi:farnesyl diphosphate synthase
MKYSIFSGGKRFRSSIIVNTGKIFNISYKKLIVIAAAVECIHSYSLIHDDLPAMDNDDLRRGKLSAHKKFNEFTAILAGNSLLTLAFEILSDKNFKFSEKVKNQLVSSLAVYVGLSGLAGGQYFDLTFENKKISKKKIIEIQKDKTGKLFAFCCECAGIIKGQSLKKRSELGKIGLDIGLLFQITDDLIDFKGDSKVVGKPTKSDKNKGKPTLVNLIGYNKTLIFAKNLKKKINKRIKKYGIKSYDLIQSIDFILDRKF